MVQISPEMPFNIWGLKNDTMDAGIALQYLGYIVGIIASIFTIHYKRKLSRLQSRTERAKASYYKSKKKAEEARQADHTLNAGKTLWDWITGNKEPRDAV